MGLLSPSLLPPSAPSRGAPGAGAVAWLLAAWIGACAAGCACSEGDPDPGTAGAPCASDGECNEGLRCSDGICSVAPPGMDGGGPPPTQDADAPPRIDGGPVCPTERRCGGACCDEGDECVDGACLPPCPSGLRCGPSQACCGAEQLCIEDACVSPGDPCEEIIDCPVGDYCDGSLGRCLPKPESRCEYHPPPGVLQPELQWRWPAEGATPPDSVHVMMTPVVGDLTADGVPEVVFITYSPTGYTAPGVLRVLAGADGSELFTIDTPTICGSTAVALGDLQGDGSPEILAAGPCRDTSRIHAFDAEGNHLWSSVQSDGTPFVMNVDYGGPALADLEGDGTAEVVLTGTVIEHDGTLRFSHRTDARFVGVPYDVDGDGDLEVVASNGVWQHDGTALWDEPTLPNGLIAVADFFEDDVPDLVIVVGGELTIRRAVDGEIVWGPVSQPGGGAGGPPTVADFDGDGLPEIGVAAAASYAVYDPDGAEPILWTSATEDDSSSRTGSSVFDFDGDGSAEVVYNDECYMRIYQGRDGEILAQVDQNSHTRIEYPVIVDVDADGNAEIVFAANSRVAACSHSGEADYTGLEAGVRVYRDAADNWVGTRRVWNQHGYSITHVREDLRVPSLTTPNWRRFNNFRQNPQSFDAPDLTPSSLDTDTTGCPSTLSLRATVTNQGAAPVGPGLAVTFYVGAPDGESRAIGTARTTTSLFPGASETVSVSFAPEAAELSMELPWFAVVDDVGDGSGEHNECVEDNNRIEGTFNCPGLG